MAFFGRFVALCVLFAAAATAEMTTVECSGSPPPDVQGTFLHRANGTAIRENHRFLTRNPHLAGSVYNNELADFIAESWTNSSFDSVRKVPYSVLLSYPDKANPNTVAMIDELGSVRYMCRIKEDVLRPEDDHPDFVHFYNSYAPNGTAEGELVYVNFATVKDFEALAALGVDVKGKIVIAQYGSIYRGNKVSAAAEAGALGILLYNDPYSNAQDGQGPDQVYPHTSWLPGSGAQRGSIKSLRGDAQTPLYPSLEDVYRMPVEELSLPKIPCQPIAYDDAREILALLGGRDMPDSWKTVTNLTQKVGPGFMAGFQVRKVRMTINNSLRPTNITNVIGIIRGSVEPDRYVIAGNHRDAWGFGGVDPSSGTSQMLEVTRLLGTLLDRGWRPRRSIVFCSWDAEEFGLIGSYEWVEENLVKLGHRAVVYVNTDTCASGELFSPNVSPLLYHLLIDITKKIVSPLNGSLSLYDTWLQDSIRYGRITPDGQIKVPGPKGGTDHVPFAYFAGVPTINLSFRDDWMSHRVRVTTYPAYHTGFDTFYLFDTFVDPTYAKQKACVALNGLLLTEIADARLLPHNVTHFAQSTKEAFSELRRDGIYDLLLNRSLKIDVLESKIEDFAAAAADWQRRLDSANLTSDDALLTRGLNDQLSQLEQTLLNTNGLPYQTQYRHLIYALGVHDMYGSSSFPGIRDLVFEIRERPEAEEAWLLLERHLSDLLVALHAAASFLKPLHVV